jgi:hypothetical protein
MHDVGSSIPFTESSSHNSRLIPIFFRSTRACPWSLVFLSVLSNVLSSTCTHSSRHASHQLNDGRLNLSNTVAPKKSIASSTCHLLQYSCQSFSTYQGNMDILNHFIDFMTCEMRWRMPLLSVTIEFILHTLKLVFHWNVASMSHVHYFS